MKKYLLKFIKVDDQTNSCKEKEVIIQTDARLLKGHNPEWFSACKVSEVKEAK